MRSEVLGAYAPIIGAILVAGVFGAGFAAGHKVRDGAAQRERAAAVEAQMDETLKEIERGNKLARELEEKNRKLRGRSQLLNLRADRIDDCPNVSGVTRYFVGVHDAAATGSDMPEAPRELACQATGVTNTDLARTVIRNYAACNEYAEQLNTLIDYVEGQDR